MKPWRFLPNPVYTPLRLCIGYLLLAGLWLLGSDAALQTLDLPPDSLRALEVCKGFFFVGLTGLLLWIILERFRRHQQHVEQALRDSREQLALAMDSAREGLWDWDLVHDQVHFSEHLATLTGMPLTIDSKGSEAWLNRLHPNDREREREQLQAIIRAGHGYYEGTYRMLHSDGVYRWLQSRGRLLFDDDGTPVRFIGLAMDVTARRADEDRLRQAAAVFESTQEGVLVTDSESFIIHVNPAFTRITGYSAGEALGKTPALLKSGRHGPQFYARVREALNAHGNWSGEIWNRRKDGEIYPQWQCIRGIRDDRGELCQYVAVFSDISAIKRSQHELDYLAHHDPLTNLANRLAFNEQVKTALNRAVREQQSGAMMLVDLDHFKHVNESLGHTVGDQLLKVVGERLQQVLGPDASLARLGGDEFGVLLEHAPSAEVVATQARALLDNLLQPCEVLGNELFVNASIGICLFPEDAGSVAELISHGGSALSKAKSDGRGSYAFYTHSLTHRARQHVELATALRRALEHDELRLHYQPILDLQSGVIVGVESLVRWEHPQRGQVPPGEFIPIAEENGLIGEIDAWVLKHACQQMQRWKRDGVELDFIAVNVSSRLFGHGELDTRVAQVLAETGLEPGFLELEVTESAVMQDPDAAQQMLIRLRGLGVRLAIDDFGTGYSSLLRLKRMPVHKLKIDQGFVAGIPHDKEDIAITLAIIGMARSLGLGVLAEGIENAEQAEFLRANQCAFGQGYLFGRPQTADQLAPRLRQTSP